MCKLSIFQIHTFSDAAQITRFNSLTNHDRCSTTWSYLINCICDNQSNNQSIKQTNLSTSRIGTDDKTCLCNILIFTIVKFLLKQLNFVVLNELGADTCNMCNMLLIRHIVYQQNRQVVFSTYGICVTCYSTHQTQQNRTSCASNTWSNIVIAI